ncbi:uncharacterized protein BP01DRAFT_404617 [Aspergillus saccharolyticus JOP 1030-1]|uniref:ubiquitinyl hydrolase 1 n=1 Tax=Aspergillus saccharolyticus JOP 1030-1 TaxID=1450539 RepID=A0A318Z874_9EURO|nr:hypothetical protein BP01DRAFT_404617 [Aspergillus saccharolyticus JOP 1030-1]PYH42617.1 hypothetical protein BP01DRAFT_404617 [Aspergillus saccharolyticus JOP 1030-1]
MATSSSVKDQGMPLEQCLYLFHHVFLPPRLPQEEDYRPELDILLLTTVIDALHGFRRNAPVCHVGTLTMVIQMMLRFRKILGIQGELNEDELRQAFRNLSTEESFELSPRNRAIITTLGRLQRQFPGPTIALSLDTFNQPELQDIMAQTLAKMSYQPAVGTMAKVHKAGELHDEDRDTTHPKMVTELFMAFLRSVCTDTQAVQIMKNTRDDVMWLNSRRPWRRSSLWLMARVVLQLCFRRFTTFHETDDMYKHVMVYFLGSMLRLSHEVLPSENLHCMSAKILRRLLKLSFSNKSHWYSPIQRALEKAKDTIQHRWRKVMARQARHNHLSDLAGLNFSHDIYCSIPSLDIYLEGLNAFKHVARELPENLHPFSALAKLSTQNLPSYLDLQDPSYQAHNLAALEDWVSSNLDFWLNGCIDAEDTCARLGRLINDYHSVASSAYSNNPEAFSCMLLTILELWIACDRSATHIHEILNDYDANVPVNIFCSLLLPFRSQMERLARAEEYLRQRRLRAKQHGWGIFWQFGTVSFFAVRYFDQSNDHQRLLREIQDRAQHERLSKVKELQSLQQRYLNLMALADKTQCMYTSTTLKAHPRIIQRVHDPKCPKEAYKQQANSLHIQVHEWPLPQNPLKAKSTVFELNLPRPFRCWRDNTIFFLVDVLRLGYQVLEKPVYEFQPQLQKGLRGFFKQGDGGQRIGLLSEIKPHTRTQAWTKYSQCHCGRCKRCFVTAMTDRLEIANMCSYKLPMRSTQLQRFLFRPPPATNAGPSPNTVIASQDTCPSHMSLEEYKALCTMPLGFQIQWQNVLLQLTIPLVDYKKVETNIFIHQIMNQAGPSTPDSTLRIGHSILSDELLTGRLLEQIEWTIARIKGNWELAQGLNALIRLTLRILSLSQSTKIHELCLQRLGQLRDIALDWIKLVQDKASRARDEKHRNALFARSMHLSLICAETFDTEFFLKRQLGSPADASIFLQCCMLIHDRKGLAMSGDIFLPIMYQRWRNLTYRCLPILADSILHHQSAALDMAIAQVWATYRAGSSWSAVAETDRCWLYTYSAQQNIGEQGLPVHYNILTGELLVNGLPLARLPSDYEQHETYKTLFGETLLEVMPSDVPGMQFCCQNLHLGHTVHFSRRQIRGLNSHDLCIEATKDKSTINFVPPRLLAGLLPDAFVTDHVHWYHKADASVEFRPKANAWMTSSSNWKLHRLQREHGGVAWYLVKGERVLVNMRSRTGRCISRILRPLEKRANLHCSLISGFTTLEVDLPRLQLGFDLQSGSSVVLSRQHRGMFIDPNQSLDTLIGLRNKLLLIDEVKQNRVILIPEGPVHWRRSKYHTKVKIKRRASNKIHVYTVDRQLGRLIDDESLQSRLFLCYLHALTSSCVPDPLTQKSGTDQALSILRSASVRSFVQLEPGCCAILSRIAELTPGRRYYPLEARVMQTVHWDSGLGCLAQHNEFYTEVTEIFEQDTRMRIFCPEQPETYHELPAMESMLLRRDQIRSSTFRVAEYGAEKHTSEYDRPYNGLDQTRNSVEGLQAFRLSSMVYNGLRSFVVQKMNQEELAGYLWSAFESMPSVDGPQMQIDTSKIGYDARLLLDPTLYIYTNWYSIHRMLSANKTRLNKYSLMMWLSTLAFSRMFRLDVLELLASLYTVPEMASIPVPEHTSFVLIEGYRFDSDTLRAKLELTALERTRQPRPKRKGLESQDEFVSRRNEQQDDNRSETLKEFIGYLKEQWPAPEPLYYYEANGTSPRFSDYFDKNTAINCACDLFSAWFSNLKFHEYVTTMTLTLRAQPVTNLYEPSYIDTLRAQPVSRARAFVCIDDLLSSEPPPPKEAPRLSEILHCHTPSTERDNMLAFLNRLEMLSSSDYERVYVERLRGSFEAMQASRKVFSLSENVEEVNSVLLEHLAHCDEHYRELHHAVMSAMRPSNALLEPPGIKDLIIYQALRTVAGDAHMPAISTETLLRQLTRRRWREIPERWKACFIAYGLAVTAVQRAKRLVKSLRKPDDLIRELQNPGHANWDPHQYPESLLLEVENGILVREAQEQIAQQMRSLIPGENMVVQLNMGEGKSSVIVPIVALNYANGADLARVLVARPQSKQMLQMLVSKLGGLLDRRVYHLPISRSLNLDVFKAEIVRQIMKDCITNGGVLLVQPEHLLSLKLMCLECFITGREDIGQSLLDSLEFCRRHARDIVDESDEVFSVRFELVYTMGAQNMLEMSPERWNIIHEVLRLVPIFAPGVKEVYPDSIEINDSLPGSFPKLRILHCATQNVAQQELLFRIAKHICDTGIGNLPISRQPVKIQEALLTYILKERLTVDEIITVQSPSSNVWTSIWRNPLLLLRGLFAGGILGFCFGRKRFRVNYGPDPTRKPPTRLSVPYRAKDSPVPRAELSHPDVVITLTSLSYYYAGLSDDEITLAFNRLLQSDQSDIEYRAWVQNAPGLSNEYHHLFGVNLDDHNHCVVHVFPRFRFSKAVIDYFLSNIVFLKEMRQFPSKLSASGWDLGEVKVHPTGGFSGTNDSREALPLDVAQRDLPEQSHTNALVLENLLRSENSVSFIPAPVQSPELHGLISNAQNLLNNVVALNPPVQVILDVGAQILEMDSQQVSRTWLGMVESIAQLEAVVFIDNEHEICVLDRNGRVEQLQISPFANRLDACLVFLDEAHTRGIDLKLPANYRAAVTLGPDITKDKLVQACMRLRKLGHGQSVTFCVPKEIEAKLFTLTGTHDRTGADVSDILLWAISETWIDMQRSISLWATQGARFEHQCALWSMVQREGDETRMSQNHSIRFLEPESQSLVNRYGPRPATLPFLRQGWEESKNMRRILDRYNEFCGANHRAVDLSEEQERELAPEFEEERQLQRPGPVDPECHSLDPDLLSFITSGKLIKDSKSYLPAFELRETSAAAHLDVSEFPSGLYVTQDFARTVIRSKKNRFELDSYQRPVQWILLSKTAKYAIILYVQSYREYQELCAFLGVASTKTLEGLTVAADGFIVGGKDKPKTTFSQSPLKFLKILMSQIRKDCQDISKTHLGKIIDGVLLTPEDFRDALAPDTIHSGNESCRLTLPHAPSGG